PGRAGAGGGAGLAPAAAWRARPTPPGVPPDPATAAPAGVPRGGRVPGNRGRGLAGPRSADRGGGRAAGAVRSWPRFETTCVSPLVAARRRASRQVVGPFPARACRGRGRGWRRRGVQLVSIRRDVRALRR